MPFIRTIPFDQATGELRDDYESAIASGRSPTTIEAWSLRTDVRRAWLALDAAIRSHMDQRRYLLVTLIAASRVKSSVCSIQHGSILQSHNFTAEQVEALVCDYRAAGLDAVDEAIIAFTERVVFHAHEITQDEVGALRGLGLSDEEIFDIVLAATYRLGWSTANDAIGYEASQPFLQRTHDQLGDQVFQALMVGRQYRVEDDTP